jgi:hypothetical protein
MSPVKAPDAAAWQSCPPIASRVPAEIAAMRAISVAGGQISMSILVSAAAPSAMARASSSDAPTPFIFQLPAIRCVRAMMGMLAER